MPTGSGRASVLLGALVLALGVAACGGSGPTSSRGDGPTGVLDSAAPTASPAIGGSSSVPSPSIDQTPGSSGSAGPSPSSGPYGSSGPGASSVPVSQTAPCYGSSDTKDFFASFAQAVPWPVYCVTLPSGWSVAKGVYRLRDGGELTISYQRRVDGAQLTLDEGARCMDGSGCLPPGSVVGSTPFADRVADVLALTSGGVAAAVDADRNPSWLLTGTGLSQDDLQTIAAALHLVDE